MQPDPGPFEKVGGGDGDEDGYIGQEAVAEEDLSEPAEMLREGEGRAEVEGGGGQRDVGHVASGEFDQASAEEVTDADAEGGEGEAGHVLVGAEGNGEEAVQKPHEEGGENGAQKGDPDGEKGVDREGALFIEEGSDDPSDCAYIHDPGDAQVQVAALLGVDLSHTAIEKGDALHHGAGDVRDKVKHGTPPFLLSCPSGQGGS